MHYVSFSFRLKTGLAKAGPADTLLRHDVYFEFLLQIITNSVYYLNVANMQDISSSR